MVAIRHCARNQIWHFCPQRHVSTPREHQIFTQGHLYGLGPVSRSLLVTCFRYTPYSKLTAAFHGYLAKARLSCSTCFVLSIGNKHSNEISCRRVGLSPTRLSPRWRVAEMTGDNTSVYSVASHSWCQITPFTQSCIMSSEILPLPPNADMGTTLASGHPKMLQL